MEASTYFREFRTPLGGSHHFNSTLSHETFPSENKRTFTSPYSSIDYRLLASLEKEINDTLQTFQKERGKRSDVMRNIHSEINNFRSSEQDLTNYQASPTVVYRSPKIVQSLGTTNIVKNDNNPRKMKHKIKKLREERKILKEKLLAQERFILSHEEPLKHQIGEVLQQPLEEYSKTDLKTFVELLCTAFKKEKNERNEFEKKYLRLLEVQNGLLSLVREGQLSKENLRLQEQLKREQQIRVDLEIENRKLQSTVPLPKQIAKSRNNKRFKVSKTMSIVPKSIKK